MAVVEPPVRSNGNGGMLVQKRECKENSGEGVITIRVSTVSHWHDISIQATSTFGKHFFFLFLKIFINLHLFNTCASDDSVVKKFTIRQKKKVYFIIPLRPLLLFLLLLYLA